jgi:hypothetical protein
MRTESQSFTAMFAHSSWTCAISASAKKKSLRIGALASAGVTRRSAYGRFLAGRSVPRTNGLRWPLSVMPGGSGGSGAIRNAIGKVFRA